MRKSILFALLVCLALAPAVNAQGEEEEAKPYFYATYFTCDVNGQWRVDEIAETLYAPIYDAAVEDGTISGWGWLSHHTGGTWRRALYHVAPSPEALLDALDAIGEKIDEKNEPASREFGRICNSHDDYIWQDVISHSWEERGEAGFSVYMVCDMAREERADEIVEEPLSKVYNKPGGEGKLTTWGWARHIVGGQWRRIATMTAADHKTLLKIRGQIFEEVRSKHKDAADEFNEICSSHQDYMWDIELEKP